MSIKKTKLSDIIPSSSEEIREQFALIMDSKSIETDDLVERIQALNVQQNLDAPLTIDWLGMFNPFTLPNLQDENDSLLTLIRKATEILEPYQDKHFNDLMTATYTLSIALKAKDSIDLDFTCQHQSIIDLKSSIKLDKVYGLTKPPTWDEILAAHSLLEIYQEILQIALTEMTSQDDDLNKTLEGFNFYNKPESGQLIDMAFSMGSANELHQKRKGASKGGKEYSALKHIKERLKPIYFEKFAQLSNRMAAYELYRLLTPEEVLTFKTDMPEETIASWISTWKKESLTEKT